MCVYIYTHGLPPIRARNPQSDCFTKEVFVFTKTLFLGVGASKASPTLGGGRINQDRTGRNTPLGAACVESANRLLLRGLGVEGIEGSQGTGPMTTLSVTTRFSRSWTSRSLMLTSV